MIFSNIPWTQVVLACCAAVGTLIALITIFHKLATAALERAVTEIKDDLREIFNSVSALNDKVGIQNGRITRLEDWRIEHTRHSERMFDFIKQHYKQERDEA